MRKQVQLVLLTALALIAPRLSAQTVETVPGLTSLFEPYGIAVDFRDNTYYLTDGVNNRILKYVPKTQKATTIGLVFSPQGIAVVDRAGLGHGIVVADPGLHQIQFINPDTGASQILAGSTLGRADNAIGTKAQFASPAGLVATPDGTIYVADLQNNRVRRIDNTANAGVTTVAPSVSFNRPSALAFDAASGLLYVVDTGNDSVKVIDTKNGDALTREITGFTSPRGIVFLGGEIPLLVADTGASALRIAGGSGNGDVFAGVENSPGSNNGAALSAHFDEPVGLALDANGAILVADLKNNQLRRILREKAITPGVFPASGTYNNSIKLFVTNDVQGLVYFTDLSNDKAVEPNLGSRQFSQGMIVAGGPVTGGPEVIQLRTFNPDQIGSDVSSNTYTFAVAPLTVLPAGGTFSNDVFVAVSTVTSDAVIKFVTDTSDLATWNDRTISSNNIFLFQGTRSGFADSPIVTNVFTFVVADPTISPAGASSNNTVHAKLSSATAGAILWWTTDGTDPLPGVGPSITNGGTVTVAQSGRLKVIGAKPGYFDSKLVSADFNLTTANPIITADRTDSDNDIEVTLSSLTPESTLFYAAGGTNVLTSTNSVANGKSIILSTSGALSVVARRENFNDSQVSSTVFHLKVGKPTITPAGATSNNGVPVTLSSTTANAILVWTIDGTEPTLANGTQAANGSTFTLGANGILKVAGFKAGYESSDTSSFAFNLQVAKPSITLNPEPKDGVNINSVGVTLATATTGSTIKYTTDGSAPAGGTTYTGSFTITTNANLQVVATRDGFVSSDAASQALVVQVDTPVMTPPGGFFQDGTTLTMTVQRPDAKIYYTTDGSTPTEQSTLYTGPIKLNALTFPATDLRQLQARAFAPNATPSEVTKGSLAESNTIGISRDVKAGIGSTVMVPVVLGLKSGQEVRSLQYRVQVTPSSAAAQNLKASALSSQSTTTNDFIVLIGSQTSPTTNLYSVRQIQGAGGKMINEIVTTYLGHNGNLLVKDFATVDLIGVTIPKNAAEGDEYTIQVVEASATSNGEQQRVDLTTAPARKITIQNIPYVVGDSSPGGWYNAGDFGDGELDNSDVNNVFQASIGKRVPLKGTDAFNAMDAYPPDEVTRDTNGNIIDRFVGGDKDIRYLDWVTISDRSLRIDPENWARVWSTGGQLVPSPTTLVRAPVQRQSVKAQDVTTATIWSRQALVESSDVPNAQSGKDVTVPVYINVKAGITLTGLEFRAVIQSTGPALTTAATFELASGLPTGISIPDLAFNEVAYAWSIDSGLSLQGRVLLGKIHFTLPTGSAPGEFYRVRFAVADGARNRTTAADIETIAGAVWVGGPALPNPFGRISDEWRQKFFGSLDNLLGAPDADPDGDGVTNSDEYSKGTNPAKLRFHNLLSEWKNAASNGFKLRFFAAPGQIYVIESAPDAAGPWTEVARFTGDGTIKEQVDKDALGHAHFYRIRAIDPDSQ
jgi:YVTN family beta-propeller protein